MKIANTRTKVVVGGFLLVVGIIAIAGVLLVGNGFENLRERKLYHAAFADAAGLSDGALVKLGGVTVGHVSSIELQMVNGEAAAVAGLDVDGKFAPLIRTDTRIQLRTQGMLGDRYLALMGGNPKAGEAPDGANIATVPEVTLEQVAVHARTIFEGLEPVIADIHRFTKGLPDGAELQKATDGMVQTAEAARRTVLKLNAPGSTLDVVTDPANGARLKKALGNFELASDNATRITAKIDDGDGTLGLLVNDPGLYDDARAVLGKSNRSRFARSLVREALRQKTEAPAGADAH